MNKRMFWLIWAIGLVPMLSAMAMYYGGFALPEGRVNKGELVVGQQLSSWFDAEQLPDKLNNEHWNLILTAPRNCDSNEQCTNWWQALQKIQVALGKDSDRVVLQLLDAPQSGFNGQSLTGLGEAVWIADPLGNLVLRYEFSQSPRAVLDDLRKLLKLSKVG
ncbi:hypothetical protein ACFVYJ_05755 [Pontibacter sp. JAM-7]|uniref:hypothetical protein n=1 Tax=Pontibacter sp. JAM-7 TaxID=3366581 RepID=UPI003AF792E9